MKKKKIVKNLAQLNFYKMVLTQEEFYKKFELSPRLKITICAMRLAEHISITDRVMTKQEVEKHGVVLFN